MKDRLKQYVEDHRGEFELYQPREHLWKAIDERMQHGRRGALWQRLAIAASVLLVITCGTWIFIASRNNSPATETVIQAQPSIMAAEAYFTAIVQRKDAEMVQYCGLQPKLCREFEKDLATLNKAYYQLKKEYAVSADKKTLLQAMMTNLQMQVQLISQQLQIMETAKQKKEEVITI